MPNLRLNEAEQEALSGMDYAAICLYVMAIRPRMDFKTGAVGLSPCISWQALREWLYIEPRPGVKANIPSIDAIRRMAHQLVKNELLRIESRDRQLVFFCPLADTDKFVQKKAASKPPGQPDREAATSEVNSDKGFDERTARQAAGSRMQEAATHPDTGKPNTPPPPSPPPLRVDGGGAYSGECDRRFRHRDRGFRFIVTAVSPRFPVGRDRQFRHRDR